jgi:hypothetical protein
MRPLVPAVTELRLAGTGMLLGGLIFAAISLRTDGFHDRLFYAGANAALAFGTYFHERRSAPTTVEAVSPPPTPFREGSAETVARIAGTMAVVTAGAAAIALSFADWEFMATGLAGPGAGLILASIPLRRWEREHASRLLQEPAPLVQIDRRPWRDRFPWRSGSQSGRSAAPWDTKTYYLVTASGEDWRRSAFEKRSGDGTRISGG